MIFRVITLVLISVLLTSCGLHRASCALTPSNPLCASTDPATKELPVPSVRIAQKGYSFLPLNEEGWLIGSRSTVQLVLGKRAQNRDESFVIHATLVKIRPFKTLEDFVQLVRKSQAEDTDPQRHKILKHDVAAFTGKATECAMTHSISEDNAAARVSGNTGVMILEILSLSCAHPKDKHIAVSINFSQRYYPGNRDSAFMDKADSVLTSLDFSDL